MVDEIANIKKKFVFQFFYIKLFFYFDRSRKFYSEEEQFYRTNPKMIAKEATIAEGGTILGKLVCICICICMYMCVCPRYFSTGVRALVRGHVWYSNWLVLHIKGHLSHGKRDFNYVRIELLTGSWIDFSSSFLELILSRPRVVPLCWPLWFWCFSLKSLRYSFYV